IDQITALAPDRHDGLNGSATLFADKTNPLGIPAPASQLDDWANIDAYIRTIRAPRGAKTIDPTKVAAGKTVFLNAKCQGCHSGKLWTISEVFYTRTALNAFTVTEALSGTGWDEANFPVTISPTGSTNGTMRGAPSTGNDSMI